MRTFIFYNFTKYYIIKVITSSRMRWIGHREHTQERREMLAHLSKVYELRRPLAAVSSPKRRAKSGHKDR
jgi:hypothetical protein